MPDQRDDYGGEALTIHDNRGVCSHAGHCPDGLPAVWRLRTEPWIDPDGAAAEEIIATIKKCPPGALAWTERGEAHDAWHSEQRILVIPGGPYAVQGGAEVRGVEWLASRFVAAPLIPRCRPVYSPASSRQPRREFVMAVDFACFACNRSRVAVKSDLPDQPPSAPYPEARDGTDGPS